MERAEKIGLGVASAAHVLLFGLLSSNVLRAPDPLKLHNPPIEVSLVGPVALESTAPKINPNPPPSSRAPETGPEEEAKPAPTPPAPLQKAMPKATPAPPPPKALPPKPKPAPKPVALAKPAPKPAPPKPAPAARSLPTPSRTAPPKAPAKPVVASGKGTGQKTRGSQLGPDFLKGINSPTPAPANSKPTPAAGVPAAKMGPAEARALNDEIGRQIYRRLRLPSGADVELLVASLDVKLDHKGAVIGQPTVLSVSGITDSNRPQVELYKERAIQAVMQASPFQNLPPQFYEQWRWLSPLRVYARKAQ
jgi:outer membrane biosynthesis protein TonB